MRQTTVLFLVKDSKILLAMKKRGHGVGKWNGVGGKVEEGETIEQAAIRETQEEIRVTPLKLTKVARITFNFPPERNFNHNATVFICEAWNGEPQESKEMRPQWFDKDKIPYDDMWESDRRWLPKVLAGKKVIATVDSTADNDMAEYSERDMGMV